MKLLDFNKLNVLIIYIYILYHITSIFIYNQILFLIFNFNHFHRKY